MHRRMGVHITFVRSCDLDKWTEDQLQAMKLGGNGNAKIFFEQKGWTAKDASSMVRIMLKRANLCCDGCSSSFLCPQIDEKYQSRAAKLYKQVILRYCGKILLK